MQAARLDIGLALRQSFQALRADALGIGKGGLLLVVLPSLLVRLLAPEGGYGPDVATLVTTLRAVLAMLFVSLVSWGVVARLAGLPLPPEAFFAQGLRRAQPGLKVALLVGAAIVFGLILRLFATHGTPAGFMLQTLLLTLGLWALCTLMPAVPVAVVERLGPVDALKRAAALTAGNRDRTLLLGLLLALVIGIGALLISRATDAAPALEAAFELLAWGVAAIVPSVVYAGLRIPQ
ncbi:hypothetical protein FHS79_003692 [Polymorphobacter multimanifer]|uniref:Glycerophosphoryl diester phosphodiesterase membrane domain-containing protein n=1 Tax=Polymorphobacter multimanifer TaxID=1070431 RepID=A0A841L8W2_9SPHN|nr:hypothetical protein [Polymorphobacter multimanifer]MBB6229489.1 hypothetical protein [Polymorphobacter multimanifer]